MNHLMQGLRYTAYSDQLSTGWQMLIYVSRLHGCMRRGCDLVLRRRGVKVWEQTALHFKKLEGDARLFIVSPTFLLLHTLICQH